MADTMELNMNEMEQVVGGKGGSREKLKPKKGYKVYQIVHGDTLTKIAYRFDTTVDNLINRDFIHNRNDITAGYYIYVPA